MLHPYSLVLDSALKEVEKNLDWSTVLQFALGEALKTTQTIVNETVADFNSLKTWEEKYTRIIQMGRELPHMDESQKNDENKVRGCQSQVWMVARFEDGKIFFSAESDASIVQGLIAILLKVYSGRTPKEILDQSPDFIQELGLNTNLSQSRANGLVAMIKQIKFYALGFQALS
jgi:cysteine desulfuration protein SufE